MLKSLIKIRFQGIFMRSMKGSKNKNAGIGKLALMVLVFAYIAIVFGSMFGYMFNMVLEPFTAIGYEWLYFGIMAVLIALLGVFLQPNKKFMVLKIMRYYYQCRLKQVIFY